MKRLIVLSLLLLALSSSLVPIARAQGRPTVRAVLFWATTCPHCHVVLNETLPPLQEKYGDQLHVLTIEVSEPAGHELWLAAMDTAHVPPDRHGVPMLFIGDKVLVGSYEIPNRLPELIEQYLAAGGVDYPAIPALAAKLTPPACALCEEQTEIPTNTATPTSTSIITPTPPSTPEPSTPSPTPVLPTPSPTPAPIVHFWLFYDSHCDDCRILLNDILPPILAKYPAGQVVVHEWDLAQGDSQLMRALEKRYRLLYGAIPEIFIGDRALLGNEQIKAKLEELISHYLALGGVALPTVELTPEPTPATAAVEDMRPIHVAYFYQPGCRECDRVQLDLNYLQHRYPQLVVHEFDVKAEAALCEWLGARAGVPEEKRLTAPAIFVGDEALVGETLTSHSLEALIARYAGSGAEAAWEGWEAAQEQATASIVARFRSFGVLTVLAAGLVDGLNPCAFATIVFFISYLAFMGRRRREVLVVGAAFALGVFLTYLGVGVGLLKFLASLPFLAAISRWVYGLTAALCLFLAAGSLYDWWQARRGKPEEMRLKLPLRLRRWINRVIREGAGLRAFAPAAFVTGLVISLIELACTGQVYLPTIVFVLGMPELRARAVLYLLLYNLMFILPLVVVFLLAYWGTTSEQLGEFISRRAGTVKLATVALFVLLAGWLVVALL